MTLWAWAAGLLLPPLLLSVASAGRGTAAARLVAIQLASSLGTLALVALTFVDDQASSIDLALTAALLSLPATLLFAVFEERWL